MHAVYKQKQPTVQFLATAMYILLYVICFNLGVFSTHTQK